MYSSNSFLNPNAGGQPQQYGQQPQQQQYGGGLPQQQQQQQPTGFMPQPTGFGMGQMQPQPTGFPGGQQQQQQQAPSFQSNLQQPQMTGYPQPQTFQPQQQQPQIAQQPQPTVPSTTTPRPSVQTSSQIAQSFQGGPGSATTTQQPQHHGGSKIPSMRLSFITAQDQAKFEQLFKSAVGDSQSLDGDAARDLLLRSHLPGSDLSKIWVLADTTKSGRLLFPEFALAMYLCNLRLTNRDLPSSLPERIANEVSSMVDMISFAVPDNQPAAPQTNVPKFDQPLMQNTTAPPPPQQPRPQQPSNTQLLNQLTAQPTGFYNQSAGLQAPSIVAPQATGFPGQAANLQPQQTGLPQNPQATGYSGPRPPMPPMPTGFASGLAPPQPSAPAINAQPTGIPGQWGFVNAPATGLPNIEALQQRLMPQPGREGGFTTAGLAGNATIPWAVTKDEKKIYDDLFRAWDGLGKGFIGGDVAIEVMGQSGLASQDLERIWTLSDPNNRGRLNKDEFAVAMHLMYRKLNGYPIPNRLPPELVPPSTRNLNDSIGTVKSLLSADAESRKSSGAFLQPQKTGVSYLKNHSFRAGSTSPGLNNGRKDATVFKNDDNAVGYKSSARRRMGANRSASPASSAQSSEKSDEELSVEQIKKKIREAKIMLDATDFKDENRAEEDEALNRRDRREAESLLDRIRRVQDDIDTDPKAAFRNMDSSAERRSLRRQLQSFQDQLPEIASGVRKTERAIADAKLELFRLKDAKENPGNAMEIVGTGPGGAVTESDRIKARARARMQARAAELAGRPPPATDDGSATRRLEEEKNKVMAERERNDAMSRDVEESVKEFCSGLEDGLKGDDANSTRDHERRRWEEALGVEDQIRDFIYDLQRNRKTAKVRKEEEQSSRGIARDRSPLSERYQSPGSNARRSPPPSSSPSAAGMTHEQRVASARERAQKRIAERMAAAGLKPAESGESFMERQEREKREKEERLRQAEEEDARREQERQRRLESERTPPPPAAKAAPKKPPPPPSRKVKVDTTGQNDPHKAEEDTQAAARAKAEQDTKEQAIRAEQEAQEAESQRLEEEARQQEEELAREKQAAQARLKALEEQVRQGKMKKQEEKRRKQLAEQESKEKEARLAAQRAELEAAQERERELQRQLEGLGDEESSSDEEGPDDIGSSRAYNQAPEPPAPASIPSPPTAPPVPPVPVPTITHEHVQEQDHEEPSPDFTSPLSTPEAAKSTIPTDTESKNPYFRQLHQTSDHPSAPQAQTPAESITTPSTTELQSTNPFHRLAQQEKEKPSSSAFPTAPTPLPGPLERKSRARPEDDDDWSVAESDNSSDDEDRAVGGSAKQLASILFGTMAPPRPLSAMDDKPESSPSTPTVKENADPPQAPPPPPPQQQEQQQPNGADEDAEEIQPAPSMPPPPPPLPGMQAPTGTPPPPPPPPPGAAPPPPGGAPPPPPPPPPPGGSAGGPPAGPPAGRGALLASIQAGRGLKKVETNDKSTSSSAGRVL